MWKTITFERDQLYGDVWLTPMNKIAENYGVSSSKIAEACKQMSIPRPPQGYWMRIFHGKAVKKTPLPPIGEDSQTEVKFEVFALNENQRRLHSKITTLKMDHAERLGEIVIPEHLSNPHPIVAFVQ